MNQYIYINISLPNIGFVPAGVITFNDDKNFSAFSYYQDYIDNNYPPLNPATLNWRVSNTRHFVVPKENNHRLDRTFWDLIPSENDWSAQILMAKYPNYGSMNNLKKLYFLKSRIVGGLESYVKDEIKEENINSLDWLEHARKESVDFYFNQIDKVQSIKLINPMTSYGGMRPKTMYEDEFGDFWIAKFNLPDDPYNMARIEKTALDISADMGLNTAENKIITLSSGEDVFLSKRFDIKKEKRYHSLSLYSLLTGNEAKIKNPGYFGNSGLIVFDLIRNYSDFKDKNTIDILNKFLLDITVNNTDNHLKNLRIILNDEMKWELAPIYDVIYNHLASNFTYNPFELPMGDLYLDNPILSNQIYDKTKINESDIFNSIAVAKKVSDNWYSYCEKNNLSFEDTLKVGNAMHLGRHKTELDRKYLEQLKNKTKNKIILPVLKPKN